MRSINRSVNLKRSLLLRVTLCALLICVLASALILLQAKTHIRERIAQNGTTIERLIYSAAVQPRGQFRTSISHSLEGLQLSMLEELGRLINICVAVDDITTRRIDERCFGQADDAPVVIRWLIGRLVGPSVYYQGTIRQHPGVKVGEFVVTPDLDTEAFEVWRQISIVLWITVGVLLLNLLIYLPVRRLLRPTDQILAVLGRMEKGDLTACMPRPELIELRRIAAGFDHLAERLRETSRGQRQLAQRLLSVREEERRHLARELHDEFGQCLASIRVEAAVVADHAREGLPLLLPSADAISRVTAHMMEALQGLLHQLRPVGLEEFGLHASLEQLLAGWQRRRPNCRYVLQVTGGIDGLADDLCVSLYRIVQESLTNAVRHGDPSEIRVALSRTPLAVTLTVDDDGQGGTPDSAGSGLGVLGMHERVQALGGSFTLVPRGVRGMRVRATVPVREPFLKERDDD